MFSRSNVLHAAVAATGAAAMLAAPARAELHSYYVGIDDLPTIASGTYAGLANPNFNNLTLLYQHANLENPSTSHYHSKAIEIYTGPNLGTNTAVIRSASNFVPEGSNPPITLSAGTGIYSGKLISAPHDNVNGDPYEWSHLTLANTQSLDSTGTIPAETFLLNSSAGRWNSNFDAAHLHWQLVSVTPGLNVGDETSLTLAAPGDEIHLTDPGDSFSTFTPVLWTDATAPAGNYEAVFRLFDEDGTFGDSGDVRIITQVVPEPASLAVMGLGAIGLMRRRRA